MRARARARACVCVYVCMCQGTCVELAVGFDVLDDFEHLSVGDLLPHQGTKVFVQRLYLIRLLLVKRCSTTATRLNFVVIVLCVWVW